MTVAEIMEAVKELKVMELSELVKALEEEFGVSATPVAVAGAAAGAADGAAAADAKTDFDVVLVEAGSSKINVIKVVREITGLGLKEAKEKVDSAPQTIKEAAPEAEANEIKEKLEAAGAGDGAAAADAKTDFDVVLVEAGSSKINVIKVVREITGLGLKEAKEKVDSAPQTIKEAAPEAEANEIKEKLEAAGAKVELK